MRTSQKIKHKSTHHRQFARFLCFLSGSFCDQIIFWSPCFTHLKGHSSGVRWMRYFITILAFSTFHPTHQLHRILVPNQQWKTRIRYDAGGEMDLKVHSSPTWLEALYVKVLACWPNEPKLCLRWVFWKDLLIRGGRAGPLPGRELYAEKAERDLRRGNRIKGLSLRTNNKKTGRLKRTSNARFSRLRKSLKLK